MIFYVVDDVMAAAWFVVWSTSIIFITLFNW